jgi:hypothetical protein
MLSENGTPLSGEYNCLNAEVPVSRVLICKSALSFDIMTIDKCGLSCFYRFFNVASNFHGLASEGVPRSFENVRMDSGNILFHASPPGSVKTHGNH